MLVALPLFPAATVVRFARASSQPSAERFLPIPASIDPIMPTVHVPGPSFPESEFEQNGIVTEKGLAQLREYLSEVPAERFKTPMKVADIPRLFTPTTFCKLVVRAQKEAA